eukprot:1605853-Rhodomonas_salina.3
MITALDGVRERYHLKTSEERVRLPPLRRRRWSRRAEPASERERGCGGCLRTGTRSFQSPFRPCSTRLQAGSGEVGPNVVGLRLREKMLDRVCSLLLGFQQLSHPRRCRPPLRPHTQAGIETRITAITTQ